MTKQFFIDRRPHNGETYEEYMNSILERLKAIQSGNIENPHDEFIRLNYQRSARILNTYKVSPEISELVNQIRIPQLWMVLTESWCGDSAQLLPHLYKISLCGDLIEFRILRRDDNLDIMDQYLLNGKSRSIPRLVAFDHEGNELFTWGARPNAVSVLIDNWKRQGLTKDEFIPKIHAWYAKDKGKSLEVEFKEIFTNLIK